MNDQCTMLLLFLLLSRKREETRELLLPLLMLSSCGQGAYVPTGVPSSPTVPSSSPPTMFPVAQNSNMLLLLTLALAGGEGIGELFESRERGRA